MGIWTQLIGLFDAARRRDLAYRALILTVFASVFVGIRVAWPALLVILHGWALSLRGAFNLFLVYAIFFLIIGSIIAPRFIRGSSRRISSGVGRFLGRFVVWILKLGVMGAINTVLYVVQLLYAAISPQNAADRVIDASTHYLERMADLVIRPQR